MRAPDAFNKTTICSGPSRSSTSCGHVQQTGRPPDQAGNVRGDGPSPRVSTYSSPLTRRSKRKGFATGRRIAMPPWLSPGPRALTFVTLTPHLPIKRHCVRGDKN
ncbi:hypothetical protein BaRGS_00021618 [Batillaria attramentaria]|uniref:Uncharacterized protein n=1 Tax=Batillaria attramentaria TaxID=370345 RepID=A0ABD0KJ34_9CAEN